jgi:glycerol kinase
MSGYVLAIDQGTTGTTVVVLDEDAQVRGRGYSEFAQHFPHPGWVEHDPETIWQVTLQVVEQALDDAGIRASDLTTLGITNQRETTVLWERSTSRPVANAIVWQDRRTASRCAALHQHTNTVRTKTGLVIDPYFSATKIAWLLDNVDGLRDRAGRGEIAFGTIDSWLIWKLTGGRQHITDVTNASRTMLLDIASLDWDDQLLELFQVPREVLPQVRPSSQVYGDTDPQAFLGAAVPIGAAVGDQQAALFAQACFEPGQAKNTYGTGSFVLVNTGGGADPDNEALLRTIAYQIGEEPAAYAMEGPILATGSAVQWLRDQLGVIRSADETEALAASLEGNDDVYFVPALAGLAAPTWDPTARGTLVGITRGSSKAHLVRAVLESIAYQTCDVVQAMERESHIPVTELRADGGATANRWLMQFQADMLGIPVDVPDNTETTSLGSAYLAGLATGVFPDRADLARRRRTAVRYEPRDLPNRQRLLARWHDALERAREWATEDQEPRAPQAPRGQM